ncbi:MAG: hypothetical protein LLG20_12350 [Acidobacteriales bacterium]|nr:hypothetical protein [Terriglobales bacterium]
MFETLQRPEYWGVRRWMPPLAALTASACFLFWQIQLPPRFVHLHPRQVLYVASRPVLVSFLVCLVLFVVAARLLRVHRSAWIGIAAFRWASSAVWLAPLMVLHDRQSTHTTLAAAVLVVSLVRQASWHWHEISGLAEMEPPAVPALFTLVESRSSRNGLAIAIFTAAAAQCALIAHVIRMRPAELILTCAVLGVLTWQVLSTAPVTRRVSQWLAAGRKAAATLVIGFLAVCLLLAPQLLRVSGRSAADSVLPGWLSGLPGLVQPGAPVDQPNKSARRSTPDAFLDGDYPGVIVFSEVGSHTVLVPPPPAMAHGRSGHGLPQKSWSMPFFGSYWLFREPDRRPPKNSVRLVADMARRGFYTRDRKLLNMEARQNLGFDVELASCHEVAIWIRNANRRRIWLELILLDTQAKRRSQLSLGWQEVLPPPGSTGEPVTDLVRFPVPRQGPIRHFDELLVAFHREVGWSTRSARVTLERFVFVP